MLRPRFSLRSLFVLVIVASIPKCWWSRQLIWLGERHKFLQSLTIDSNGERAFFTKDETGTQWHQVPSTPLVRRIIDEPYYGLLVLPLKYGANEIDKAAYLFPEATLQKIVGTLEVNGRAWPNTIDVTKLLN
jgi:hypothetical protein